MERRVFLSKFSLRNVLIYLQQNSIIFNTQYGKRMIEIVNTEVVTENLNFAIRQHTKSIDSLSMSQLQLSQIALVAFFQRLTQQHRHACVTFPFLLLPDDSRTAWQQTQQFQKRTDLCIQLLFHRPSLWQLLQVWLGSPKRIFEEQVVVLVAQTTVSKHWRELTALMPTTEDHSLDSILSWSTDRL